MFVESEHPRDNDGKFTEKGGGSSKQGLEKEVSEYKAPKGEGLAKEVSDWAERKKTESKNESKQVGRIDKSYLTKQEWALWYKAVAENKALGYWAEELDNGNALLKVENKNSHKLIITGGTFGSPKAIAIYSFKSSDEMNDAIKELKELW